MLVNNQLAAGEYRHNYIRLAFLVGTLLLFIGYVTVFQIFDRGNNRKFIVSQLKCFNISYDSDFVSGNRTMNRTRFNISHDSDFVSGNRTIRAEDLLINDINPSDWVYRSLSAFNYLWQVRNVVLDHSKNQNIRLACLAFLFINIYLSSIINWLFIFITKYINTSILHYLHSCVSYPDILACIFSKKVFNCEKEFF
jgi:hypothetical protein